ncbi:MAG: FAD-binding protein [Myxococcota bacterium]|jgi:flavin-dependent dehydrogenase/NAD-dependent dihydropyrimidine dehydrogenase PreA subunit
MFKNLVILDAGKCNGCGVCVQNCPEIVFEQPVEKSPPVISHPDRCMGCMACEDDCARGCLSVHRMADGMDGSEIPSPAAWLNPGHTYDLVVIGAGPAGLGAAIRGRLLDLDVAVIERLPSQRRSHHPDGGLLFWNGIYNARESGEGLVFEELGITLPAAEIRERLDHFIFMGPGGASTKRSPAGGPQMISFSKDRLVEILADRARELGAAISRNTRAGAIRREKGSNLMVVTVDGGVEIRGRVVISAEGNTGRLAARAGIPVNRRPTGWGFALVIEQDPVKDPPGEAGFMIGPLEGLPETAATPFLSYWSAGKGLVELATGPLQKKKQRILEKPLDFYLAHAIGTDTRIAGRLGQALTNRHARLRDGCRIFARRLPDRFTGDGIIAVGDAITTCGMMTNIAAIKSGDIAAQVAREAIVGNNTSAAALAPYRERLLKIQMIKGMSWMHGLLLEAPMNLPPGDIGLLFGALKHLDLGSMMKGGMGAAWAMTKFMTRAIPLMIRRPDLRPYLDGSGGPAEKD